MSKEPLDTLTLLGVATQEKTRNARGISASYPREVAPLFHTQGHGLFCFNAAASSFAVAELGRFPVVVDLAVFRGGLIKTGYPHGAYCFWVEPAEITPGNINDLPWLTFGDASFPHFMEPTF